MSKLHHTDPLKLPKIDFRIDAVTREVTQTVRDKRITLMQYDHNSEKLRFECPRYVDGHDMSLCDKVEVHFINALATRDENHVGKYTVVDLAVSEDNPDLVNFTWVVSRNATEYVGTLVFSVRFTCLNGTEIEYAWHTSAFTYVSVDQGLVNELDESYDTLYLDNLEAKTEERIEQITTDTLDRAIEALEKNIFNDVQALGARMDTFTKLAEGSTTGDAELIDARISVDGEVYNSAGAAVRGQVNKVMTSLSNVTGASVKNLLPNNIESGVVDGITFTVNADRSVTVNGTATYTAYKKMSVVLPAGDYILNGCPVGGDVNTYHLLCSYNDAYKYDIESNVVKINLTETTTVDVYIRVMTGTTVENITFYPMIRKVTITDDTYIPYGYLYSENTMEELAKTIYVSPWNGKKANFIGDSIVYGSYGNFVDVVKNILGLSEVRNYGIGGSLIASSDQDELYTPVIERYAEMDDDADIIFVHAGTNDYSHQIPLGEPDSEDVTTFNGALNVMMSGIRKKYPDKLIVFSSILHRYNDNQHKIKCSEYRKAIEDRSYDHHIVFYDSYKYSGFDFAEGYYNKVLTSDGLHPNEKGATILGRKIAGFLNWQ